MCRLDPVDPELGGYFFSTRRLVYFLRNLIDSILIDIMRPLLIDIMRPLLIIKLDMTMRKNDPLSSSIKVTAP
jgi:hypothetical protein